MKKLSAAVVMLCLLIGSFPGHSMAALQPDVQELRIADPIAIVGDVLYLPVEATFAALDMQVQWVGEGQKKILLKSPLGSYQVLLDGDIKSGNLSASIGADGRRYPVVVQDDVSFISVDFYQAILSGELVVTSEYTLTLTDVAPNWQSVGGVTINVNNRWRALDQYAAQPAARSMVSAPTSRRDAAAFMADQLAFDMVWPTLAKTISSPFGMRASGNHTGIDIDGVTGDPVFAAADGIVTRAESYSGYGETIDILHDDGLVTRYAHLDGYATSKGDRVAAGQIIGTLGATGRATGDHLHFEVLVAGRAVDPLPPRGF